MRDILFRSWGSGADFARGTHQGTAARDGCLVIGPEAAGTRSYTDPHGDGSAFTYEQASWVSPEVRPGFTFTDLVPSWNASTPPGTWLEIEVRTSTDGVHMSRWYSLGRWAETDTDIHPTSVPGQDDEAASVAIDIVSARTPASWSTYQLRISLLRRPGLDVTPAVRLVGMMSSEAPGGEPVQTSEPGPARGIVLDVPAWSQQVHRGEYPQWDNGGESWCSPTSTSMMLGFWGTGPAEDEYAWVDAGLQDRWIDFAARHTFDYNYKGAGNWSFNTAYAARYGMTAFVTRLRSLTEAEAFIAAGIPLVVSVSFKADELDGAGYDTEGHLLTIIGFDETGNVVSNDPASHEVPSNDAVRTTYDRAQFERVWLGSAGGVTYVIHPPDVALPPRPSQPNW
jgi:hypothetical protein